jgi:drug/metabolite transporter (DMT)-like permease
MNISTILQVIIVMFLWAICFPFITWGIESAPHLTFATLRAVLSGLVLIVIALMLRQPFPAKWHDWKSIAVVGIGATSFGFFGMFHAAEFVSPGIATVISNAQPLLAAILAAFVLRERLSRLGMLGMLLGFGGIIFIALPGYLSGGNASYGIGVAYIILAALGITFSNVWIKKISGSVDALMAMGLQLLIGSIPLAIASFVLEEPTTVDWSAQFILILGILSVFGTSLVYWMWFSILKKTPLNQANSFSFFIPVFGLALGTFFFGEHIALFQWIGIALTISGVLMTFLLGSNQKLSVP